MDFLKQELQEVTEIIDKPTFLLLLSSVCRILYQLFLLSSFLGSTAQLRPWPPPQNPAEFLGGFSTIFFFTG
jgi:hypothetical protein